MNQISKVCFIAGALILAVAMVLAWRAQQYWIVLAPDKKAMITEMVSSHVGYIVLVLFLIFASLVIALVLIVNLFLLPTRKLIEETDLIRAVNADHRIRPSGGKTNRMLAESINELADQFSTAQKNVENEISLSRAEIEREKNILAAFIGELHDGVLICNAEGRIMFYNKRAKHLFTPPNSDNKKTEEIYPHEDEASHRVKEKFIGIGRSIFTIIDRNLILHALDEVAAKLHITDSYVASSFVVAAKTGKLLRIETVPVLNKKRQLSGFVFSANDITERLQRDSNMDELIQSLVKGIRASAGGIRSAVETILAYPEMEAEQRGKFNGIIHSESLKLGKIVEDTVVNYPEHMNTRWPLVPMSTDDLIETVRRKAGDMLGVSLYIEKSVKDTWIKVESYCGMMIILFVLNQLKDETDNLDFFCKIERDENFIYITLSWRGKPVMLKTIRDWNRQPLKIRKEGLELTLREVLGHHDGNLWLHAMHKHSDRSALRIIFPASEHKEPEIKKSITIIEEKSRPVFYDFDFFEYQEQDSEIASRMLTELEYTVFDTETTGLAPRGGDEIISIGAVRVVNGQILQDELFDQLIDPQREIPLVSVRIHGIQQEMVDGKPTIETVLPSFHDFCENTVLVAHNAAFDMLMLQMKEEATGIGFHNPVVDTLLLWDILHPAQEKNNFSNIAEMLGVRVVGRHTAVGDALTTAEVLCKLIPLLAQKGIYTLQDAQLASQKSKYARLKY